jgi:hypothetical protein
MIMLKQYLTVVSLGATLSLSGCAVDVVGPPVPPPPPGVVIAVEDRPYYVHGPWYVVYGHRYYWVGGHWRTYHHGRVWVHGTYRRR